MLISFVLFLQCKFTGNLILDQISFFYSPIKPYQYDLLLQEKISESTIRKQSSSTPPPNNSSQPITPDKNVPTMTPVSTILKGIRI